jgi:transmembrane protein 33
LRVLGCSSRHCPGRTAAWYFLVIGKVFFPPIALFNFEMRPLEMTELTEMKRAWMVLNAMFIANYSLYLILLLIRIPLSSIPNPFNLMCLLISYSLSLASNYTSIGDLFTQPNFYCIMVFVTAPHQLLLMPFYLLSIYHVSSFVLSNKKIFERSRLYTLCMAISNCHVGLGRLALVAEVLAVPLSLLMIMFGMSSFLTFVALASAVRQQYFNNFAMRSVFGEMRVACDMWIEHLPFALQEYYRKGRDFLVTTHATKK